ncbi:unnamed protein product (macronuclear) [Paramecium tetraurelia]|uniref:MORN repeat protein n=1 Tax=Paramecium tetraurelia TaxID=5888 RepID=A0EI38_PARTE|nr:uncharacterized protein GSPATT00027306001 [Paramecium tetraurelia]CAK94979.1 unnamed protein product [Paramecium tetraurelia]|eukprot:XP_001462352.1 hypothetical protein (macronuclear) [Paramecium tetraurelia strain d4-2]
MIQQQLSKIYNLIAILEFTEILIWINSQQLNKIKTTQGRIANVRQLRSFRILKDFFIDFLYQNYYWNQILQIFGNPFHKFIRGQIREIQQLIQKIYSKNYRIMGNACRCNQHSDIINEEQESNNPEVYQAKTEKPEDDKCDQQQQLSKWRNIQEDDNLPLPEFREEVAKSNNGSRIQLPPVTMKSGNIYEGEWLNQQKDGKGKFTWKDGSYFEGDFVQDKAMGIGKLVHVNGDSYEGEWKNDMAHGHGVFNHFRGVKYAGQWKYDLQDGEGQETWPDGTEYKGTYKEGKRHGQGHMQFQDGSKYEGNFENNEICGLGCYTWKDGKQYKGQWLNNKMHGQGECIWKDGKSYKGEYADDKKNGYGVFTWASGKRYEGCWQDGKQHGEGIIINAEGVRREGLWEYGKPKNLD